MIISKQSKGTKDVDKKKMAISQMITLNKGIIIHRIIMINQDNSQDSLNM